MGINTFGAYEGGDILRRGLNNKQLQETDTHEGVLHLQGLLLRANKAAKRLTGDKEPVCRGNNVKVKLQIQESSDGFLYFNSSGNVQTKSV